MKRVLSGMRPTGPLHIGHYLGALSNWIELQDKYQCFYFIADWHALSTMYDEPESMAEFTVDIVMDWLSVGLDPERSTMFLQSSILQHAEFFVLLSMITPLSWLERVPSYKETREQLSHKELNTIGFLGYPLLQAADIVIYRADYVPVGIDQLPHLELTREIVRKFNHMYSSVLKNKQSPKNLLPEPKELLTEAPKVPGTDGRKMSKSYGNAIYLKDSADEVWEKLRPMITDPQRVRRTDKGDPELCPVFDLHKFFTENNMQDELAEGCRTAGIGCIDCKKVLLEGFERELAPIREKRAVYEGKPGLVREILMTGNKKAIEESEKTMSLVREMVQIYQPKSNNDF